MTWAVEQRLPAMQKLVLLMLANRANHDTGDCFPSHSRLADECGITKPTLRSAISALEERGLLTVKRRMVDGVNLPNIYVLHIGHRQSHGSQGDCLGVVKELSPNQEFEPVIEPEESVLHSVQNRNMSAQEPIPFADDPDQTEDLSDQAAQAFSQPTSFKPLKALPQDKGRYVYPKAFEEFWSVYPVRDGTACKAASYESWRKLVNADCPREDIVEGAKRYAAHCKTKGLTGTPMVKQAVTWLNGRCFTEWFDTDMHDALKQMREFMGMTDA